MTIKMTLFSAFKKEMLFLIFADATQISSNHKGWEQVPEKQFARKREESQKK